MKNHKHYQLAYNAHSGTSFSPDKRAESYCKEFDETIEYLKSLDISEAQIQKYENLWVKHMSAKSRCLSPMITGPANFPVARNDKANNAEHKASLAVTDYYKKIVADAKKEAYYKKHPEARPVMSGDSDAIERLKAKLEALQGAHEKMIAANKIIRKKPINMEKLVELLGSKNAEEIIKPDFCGRVGFASYALNNNRAEIKRIESRIKFLETEKAKPSAELHKDGLKIVQNRENMRLQLFFDDKPEEETRKILKSNGFRWAPSQGAWQRQLTNNAMYALQRVRAAIAENA